MKSSKRKESRDKAVQASRTAFDNRMADLIVAKTIAAKKTAQLLKGVRK